MKIRSVMAFTIISLVVALFSVVIWKQLGGDTMLGVIIGHTAAWAELVVYFYFRKKPRTETIE